MIGETQGYQLNYVVPIRFGWMLKVNDAATTVELSLMIMILSGINLTLPVLFRVSCWAVNELINDRWRWRIVVGFLLDTSFCFLHSLDFTSFHCLYFFCFFFLQFLSLHSSCQLSRTNTPSSCSSWLKLSARRMPNCEKTGYFFRTLSIAAINMTTSYCLISTPV